MAKRKKQTPFPDLDAIQNEMRRSKSQSKYHQALKSTVGTIVVVAAIAVLVASIFLPVLRVTGSSMQPNFTPGNVLVAVKTKDYLPGDVCSFYYNNKDHQARDRHRRRYFGNRRGWPGVRQRFDAG